MFLVALFFAFSVVVLSEERPIKGYQPPPAESLIGQPCLAKDGFLICDPDLIDVILRYNLSILPAPPPGITFFEFQSVEELRFFLDNLLGWATSVEKTLPPITGPHDPDVSRYYEGEGAIGGPYQPPYQPPLSPPSSGDGNECNTCPPSFSPPPPEARIFTEEICWTIDPIIRQIVQEVRPGWQATLAGSMCVQVWAEYYPGQKYVQAYILRAYHAGVEVEAFVIAYDVQIEASCWIANDGRELWVNATARTIWYLGLKVGDFHLGLRITDVCGRTKVFTVPSK